MGTIKYVKSALYEMKKELLNRIRNQTLHQNPKVSRTLPLDNTTAKAILRFLDNECIFLYHEDNLYYLELNIRQVYKLIANLAH